MWICTVVYDTCTYVFIQSHVQVYVRVYPAGMILLTVANKCNLNLQHNHYRGIAILNGVLALWRH